MLSDGRRLLAIASIAIVAVTLPAIQAFYQVPPSLVTLGIVTLL